MTPEEIRMCEKADATVGALLNKECNVQRFIPPFDSWGGIFRTYGWLMVAGIIVAGGLLHLMGVKPSTVVLMCGVLLVVFGWLLPYFGEEMIQEAEQENHQRWLRIASILQDIWGDTVWQIDDLNALKMHLVAHFGRELRIGKGISHLDRARVVVQQMKQVEEDLNIQLVVTIKDDSGYTPVDDAVSRQEMARVT